jgi:hypothetical protein
LTTLRLDQPASDLLIAFEIQQPGSELSGFTIRGGGWWTSVHIFGSSITIKDNVFVGHAGNRGFIRGGSTNSAPRIYQNVFRDAGGGSCIDLEDAGGSIFNNTFYNSTGAIRTKSPNCVIRKNVISNCTTFAIIGPAADADYNLLWGNPPYDSLGYHQGPHDILADPQFVNPAAGDFRLAAGSPCIDAGHPDPQYNDPDGSRNDVGALPFVPGVSALLPDDHNADGMVDVRDAVLLIDRTVRAEANGEPSTPREQTQIRELLRRIWGGKDSRK